MKKVTSILLTLLLIISSFITSYAANLKASNEEPIINLVDISTHWAKETIEKWVQDELILGYPDGTFRPNQPITKTEVITLINRIYGYYAYATENYLDVKDNDWFSDETMIAKGNNYMSWYSDDMLYPNKNITREEICSIIASILSLEPTLDRSAINSFTDNDNISDWSLSFVDAVVNHGYMKGYPDNTLKVTQTITRAETVIMLDRAIGRLLNKAGTYGDDTIETIDGNVTVTTKDILLKNMIINGNLILGAGIQEGEVHLEDIEVKGNTIVNGGGENSITFTNCNLSSMIVFKVNDKIRIASVDSTIEKIQALSGSKFEGDFDITDIKVLAPGEAITFDGNFSTIELATRADILITDDTTIEKIIVSKEASETTIDIGLLAILDEIIFEGAAHVTGYGTIKLATVKVNGVAIEQLVEEKSVDTGIDSSGVKVKPKSTYTPPPVTVTGITIKTAPTKTTYNENEHLDLSGLVVTLNKSNNTTEDVDFINFDSKNITTNPANGAVLTTAITSVAISIGNYTVTLPITFNVIPTRPAPGSQVKLDNDNWVLANDGTGTHTGIWAIEDLVRIGWGGPGDSDNDDPWELGDSYVLMTDLDFNDDNSYRSKDMHDIDGDGFKDDINDNGNEEEGIKIEVTTGKGFDPIGSQGEEFKGNFDGNGHTIKNLYINRTHYLGLFGYTYSDTAQIKELGLVDVNITGSEMIGGLAGRLGTYTTQCYVTGTVTGTGDWVGGFTGNPNTTIENCYAIANVSGHNCVGGFNGYSVYCSINNCYAAGTVTGTSQIGGFVGKTCGTEISNSIAFNTTVTATTSGNKFDGYIEYAETYPSLKDDVSGNYVYNNMAFISSDEPYTYGISGTDMTALEFADAESYNNKNPEPNLEWDFEDIWEFKPNADRPTLQGVGNDDGIVPIVPITYIINDTFESDPVGTIPNGWNQIWNGEGSEFQKIVDDVYYSSNHSFKLDGEPSWCAGYKKAITDFSDFITVEAYIRPASSEESGSISLIYGTTCLARIVFIDGQIAYSATGHNRIDLTHLQDYTVDTWYHIKIVHNLINRTYDVYIDNEIKANNISMYTDNPVESLLLCSGNSSGNNIIYFDDVKVY